MAQLETTFSATELVRDTTIVIHVTKMRELRVRLWIAKQLFRLAAWITGMGIRIED